MWVWNFTASAPTLATASTYACAVPKLPSWLWATSAITAQRAGRPSNHIGENSLHAPEIEGAADQHEHRAPRRDGQQRSRRFSGAQHRPAEPFHGAHQRV